MPVGVMINALAVVLGGLAGVLFGHKLSADFIDNLNMIFGVCALGMGIGTIVLMENMPAVIFSVIFGTIIGLVIHLGDGIHHGAMWMQNQISRWIKPADGFSQEESTASLVNLVVLFCASGTGIYGSIVSGMLGDHSILLAKSILDFFTALIFACSLGLVVSFIAIPQCIIFLILFFCAKMIYPLTTPAMIADFKACGGFILLAIGFRMLKLKKFPTADMIPAMVIVMPISWIWSTYVMPLVSSIAG